MTEPLLEAKLHAPPAKAGAIRRARLMDRMDRAGGAKLALVSAPAGFGKTTLLAELAADGGSASAWLSLDADDDDPSTFWTHVIAALQRVAPGIGAAALPLITGHEPLRGAITSLLNDLRSLPTDLELVLDDYHVVGAPEIHESLAFFLDGLPPQVRVTIATRADPALPLARLRARGELVEVRAADLRFTPDESEAYLNGSLALDLGPSDLSVLADRTEGWIAALQLAGLSIRGRDDAAAFISRFGGDDRYVIDYLMAEVLDRQPPAVRRFLLHTSILHRMSGSLCDAVTGERGGRATLRSLERSNLFVIPLDDRREWYRYHHLFADVLRAHLSEEEPEQVAELHRRASAWYERHGDHAEAIDHAMAGEDWRRAADLIERSMAAMQANRQESRFRRLLEGLPDEELRLRPVLSVGYVGALMSTGDFHRVDELLDRAEETVAAGVAASSAILVADELELRRLPGALAMYRTALAQIRGDVEATLEQGHRALDLVADDDDLRKGGVRALLGLANWTAGNLAEGYRWFGEGMASLERGGYRADVVGGAVTLADIRIAQGRLRDAQRHFELGLEQATRGTGPPLRGAADMHVGLAALAFERNDIEAARRHLDQSRDLGDENGLPKNPWRWRVVAARLRHLEGDPGGAISLLDEAERVYVGDFSPDVRPVGAVRARMWISSGNLADARSWAVDRGLSPADEPEYLREFELSTLARLLVAEGRPTDAVALSDRLASAAEAGDRLGSALDALIVVALGRHVSGDVPGALRDLARALELSEHEGYVRVFLDEGEPMVSLLRRAARAGDRHPQVADLLAGAEGTKRPPSGQALMEPLSERELEVLRLLQSDLSGPGIANELVVSLNTLRTHTKNIYAKLGVNSRRAAVRRASELELFRR